MEVINQKDRFGNEHYDDRMLWDQVLTELLPTKIVWDSPTMIRTTVDVPGGMVGASWNVLLLPELTHEAAKCSGGRPVLFSPDIPYQPERRGPHDSRYSHRRSGPMITITGTDCDTSRDPEGQVIHTGETLHTRTQDIGKYVRANYRAGWKRSHSRLRLWRYVRPTDVSPVSDRAGVLVRPNVT